MNLLSLVNSLNLLGWWNGRHEGLKILCPVGRASSNLALSIKTIFNFVGELMGTISNRQYNREIKLSKKEVQKVIDSFNKQFGISHGAKTIFLKMIDIIVKEQIIIIIPL